jgi:ribosomal protein S18 acetylase RimI-like enzyme
MTDVQTLTRVRKANAADQEAIDALASLEDGRPTPVFPEHLNLVAEQDGEVCGLISVYQGEESATVNHLIVAPSCRRMGVATALLQAAYEHLGSNVRITANVKRNSPAAHFFSAAGFDAPFIKFRTTT